MRRGVSPASVFLSCGEYDAGRLATESEPYLLRIAL